MMTKHLYTVVSDFAGGTYVSQFEGSDPEDIARQWAATLRTLLGVLAYPGR